jgi:hypothetical protein
MRIRLGAGRKDCPPLEGYRPIEDVNCLNQDLGCADAFVLVENSIPSGALTAPAYGMGS